MHKLVGFTLALLMFVLCVGCSAQNPSPAVSGVPSAAGTTAEPSPSAEPSEIVSPTEGTSPAEITWLLANGDPAVKEAVDAVAALYEEETGVTLRIEMAAPSDYAERLQSAMDSAHPPTIFDLNSPAAAAQWADRCLDLAETAIAEERDVTRYPDIFDLYDGDRLVGLGYSLASFGIMVNPDLLKAADHTTEEIMDLPSLQAVAEDIHSRQGALGFDAFASVDLSADPDSYTAHLANLDYYYEQGLERWKETPAEITGEYLENYRALYDVIRTNSVTGDPTNPVDQFKKELAVFSLGGSWLWTEIQNNVSNVTMIPYYCGVSGDEEAGLNNEAQVFWAINGEAGEADQQAAVDFLVWSVTNEEASRIMVDAFGAMPYQQAQEPVNGLLRAAADYLREDFYSMNWAFLFQPEPEIYRAELAAALTIYNEEPTDANWEAFRSVFVDEWAVLQQQATSAALGTENVETQPAGTETTQASAEPTDSGDDALS